MTLVHATARAIAIVRTRSAAAESPPDTRACDGAHETFMGDSFFAQVALALLGGHDPTTERLLGMIHGAALPTCQHCRVLLDDALERPVTK